MLEKVKAIFNAPAPVVEPVVPVENAAPAPTPVKNYKTVDGAEVSIAQVGEVPAVGEAVTINGAPAAEGVLTLEDGATITIDAAGNIAAYTPAAPVTNDLTQTTAPAAAPAPPVMQPIAMEAIDDINKKIDEYTQTIARHEATIKGLFELCEKLSEVPTAEPVTLPEPQKDRFSKREDKIKAIGESIKNLKTNK